METNNPMHIPGRSEIIDQLSGESNQQPAYDIARLSHEILLRSGDTSCMWVDEYGAKLSLVQTNQDMTQTYELFVQEDGDTDIHHYIYRGSAKSIVYAYPLYNYHAKNNDDDTRNRLEQLLLSGPTADKVPDNRTENKIQKIFWTIARKLVIENLTEQAPEYRTQLFDQILSANDQKTKLEITKQLYDKTVELDTFTVSLIQFDLALAEEMMHYRVKQRQLTQGSDSNE